MSETVPFQTIQFSISMQFSSIQPIDRTLSGATILGQSGPGNEGVLHIPQTSSITRTSPLDCLVQDTLGGGVLTPLQKCSWCILQSQLTRQCLVGFYGISTIVGYSMPNPFLYKRTVLFQTIQFSISTVC